MFEKLIEVLTLLDVSEKDAIKSVLMAVGPSNPASLRQSWMANKSYGNSAPTTELLWSLMKESGFQCCQCGSSFRLQFDHINSDATDHNRENLQVICHNCNVQKRRNNPVKMFDFQYELVLATIDLWKENGELPTYKQTLEKAGSDSACFGGASYMLNYVREMLTR